MAQKIMEEQLVYTTQEVAKILHSSPNYIYELINKGKLKAIKLKSFKICKSTLEEFLKENEGNDLSDIDNVKKIAEYVDYCEVNLKYNTRRTYKTIMEKYLKPELGKYRLSSLSSVKLNSFIVELCNKYNFKKAYYNNILKVLKNCFRIATDVYGFIRYNPALTLKLPKIEYGKVVREIDDVYESKFSGKSVGMHFSGKNAYRFEIRGYNDYNIFQKWKND